jgi:hypothetical protein
MDKNRLLLVGSIVFSLVSILHLLRSIFSWEMVVNNFNVPLYFSYIAVIIAVYLSWNMYNSSKK